MNAGERGDTRSPQYILREFADARIDDREPRPPRPPEQTRTSRATWSSHGDGGSDAGEAGDGFRCAVVQIAASRLGGVW